MSHDFPTREEWHSPLGTIIYEVDDMHCPSCGWSAENELGWPKATLEFMRAGPLCRLCRTPLISSIVSSYRLNQYGDKVPA